MKKRIAVYAGTFDPVTNGHLDIINRASHLYDYLYVTIFVNPAKRRAAKYAARQKEQLLLVQVDIQMGVGHFNTGLIEFDFNILVHGKQGGPVIIGSRPDLQHILDGAVTVILHSGEGRLLFQDRGNGGASLPQRFQYAVDGSVVGGGNGNIDTPGTGGGVINDLGSGDSAVGNGHQLVVSGSQLGVSQADLLDHTRLAGYFHKVTGVEGMGGQQHKASEHIGQSVLQRQGNGQGSNGCQGDDAGDIDAQLGSNDQRQQRIQQDLCGRGDQLMDSLFQLGLFQCFCHQLHGETDTQDAYQQQDQRRQDLGQGQIRKNFCH